MYRGRGGSSRGRSTRGPRRSGFRRSSFGRRTRRSGTRATNRRRTAGRVAIGLGVVGAGLLAVNAGIIGAAGTSRAIKELRGTAKSVIGWARKRGAKKAALKASSVAFHAKRVSRMTKVKIRRPKQFKIRRFPKR